MTAFVVHRDTNIFREWPLSCLLSDVEKMKSMKSSESSLYTIDHLPIDLPKDAMIHYSKMKLGSQESARYFAKLLAPMVSDVIRSSPEQNDWVLTSPPLINICSGANWMCHHVYHLLKNSSSIPARIHLSMVEIQVSGEALSNPLTTPYSQLSVEERIASRQRDKQPLMHEEDFHGRAVVIINDINVSGTQQRFLETHFSKVSPAMIHWRYVINVDPLLGQAEPRLEYQLNSSSLGSLQEFTDLLIHEKMEYTGQCLWRLFTLPTEELEKISARLSPDQISKLLELAKIEDRWNDELLTLERKLP